MAQTAIRVSPEAEALMGAATMLRRDIDSLTKMAAGNPRAAEKLNAERRGYRLAMSVIRGTLIGHDLVGLAELYDPDRPVA